MLKRKPTRIELSAEDVHELDACRGAEAQRTTPTGTRQTKSAAERIGYIAPGTPVQHQQPRLH
ncbi:Anaphase-promoting complex APC subunit CDC26 [Plasmodiophora brassicae]|uniref:Uncharacterized protein n=1 Tax=Plasmodiophora brassicae TaxID=37360 RepID=A0A0G4IZ29_PLABS|nr:hypothetical protein PBRA_001581 [Plasmodiophora brassicae]